MKIKDLLETFRTQIAIKRTPKGRVITDFGVQSLSSALSDTANYEAEVTRCKNCGMINSMLLVEDSCSNCGGLDFDSNVS